MKNESERVKVEGSTPQLFRKATGGPFYLNLPENAMVYVHTSKGAQIGIYGGKAHDSVTVWDMNEDVTYHLLTQQKLRVDNSGKDTRGYVNK